MADDVYEPERVERLKEMLRELAQRLIVLDAEGRLLDDPASLLRALGDVRAELFRFEVRATFDSPDIARHRRIVEEAEGWVPEDNDEEDG